MAADPNQRITLLEIACRNAQSPQAVLNAAKAYEEWVFGAIKHSAADQGPNVRDIEELIADAKRQTFTTPEELP